MTVRELVAALTDLIKRSSLPRSAIHDRMIAHLEAFPDYCARRELDCWEDEWPASVTDSTDATGEVLQAVFYLACANLYASFSPEATLQEYAIFASTFRKHGLSPPDVDHIMDW